MIAPRYHLILDIDEVNGPALVDESGLTGFLQELPGKIGMNILHGPVVKTGIAANPGLSGFVIIDYSHISVHTFTGGGCAMVDVFSCKPYEQATVVAQAAQYFQVTEDKIRQKVVFWG